MPTVPTGLVVKGETLHISTVDRDERGQPLEPEERPAKLQIHVEGAPVRLGNSSTKMRIPMSISTEDIVSTFAGSVRNRCGMCKHWDHDAWLQYKRQIESGKNMEDKIWLNKQRSICEFGHRTPEQNRRFGTPDDDFDVEAFLSSGGICRLITEATKDPTMTMPDAGCPNELKNNGMSLPWSDQFTPKSAEADRRMNLTFDTIMREAEGKTRR